MARNYGTGKAIRRGMLPSRGRLRAWGSSARRLDAFADRDRDVGVGGRKSPHLGNARPVANAQHAALE